MAPLILAAGAGQDRQAILVVIGFGLVVAPVLQVGCIAAEGHQAFEDPPPEHILRFRVATACVPSAAHDLLARARQLTRCQLPSGCRHAVP